VRRIVASALGLGLVPRWARGSDSGAGTMGAALGLGIGLVLFAVGAPVWSGALAAALAIAISLWAAAPFAVDHGDPGWVAIDETAGTLVALVGLSGWPWVVAALVARLADIFKVLPGVAAAERLPGAIGVTADDVVAGLYGLGVGWLLTALL
jgi:phosphatidylglycerophosphatase A